MSDFSDDVAKTIINEGGLVNDAQDPGGITKYGISLRFLQENNIHIDTKSTIDYLDVEDLTILQAEEIYRKYFWQKIKLNLVSQKKVAAKIFDLSVNIGPKTAVKILQTALNHFLQNKIKVDGIIGLETLRALSQVGESLVLELIKVLAINYYKSLAGNNPNLEKFLDGWIARANQ